MTGTNYIKISNQVILLLASIAYIALCLSLPVGIFPIEEVDDAHYWKLAESILHGEWFGSYDKLTLAKGPTYPFFLAINKIIGFPVTLTTALLYVVASYLFTNSLYRIGLNKVVATLIYVIILFEPVLFPIKVIRDDIYTSLTLLVFAYLIRLLFCGGKFAYAGMLGVVLSFFMITREEGIWIFPGVIIVGMGAFFLKRCKIHDALFLKKGCLSLCVFSLCLGAPMIGVSLMNYIKYDYFGVVDFKAPEFKNALRALQSVVIGEPVTYLPVPEKTRQAIYAVSPAFSELRNYFTNEGKTWTVFGQNIHPGTENDYVGGWFVWALRYAVGSEGYYRSAKTANGYYERLADEIRSAQKSGALPCVSTPFSFMPVLSWDNYKRIPRAIWNAVLLTTYQTSIQIVPFPSKEPLSSLSKARKFLGNPKSTLAISEVNYVVDGWFYNKNHDWIDLVTIEKKIHATTEITRNESPDLIPFFKDPQSGRNRFSLVITNPRQSFIKLHNSGEQYCLEDLIENKDKRTTYGASMIFFDHAQKPLPGPPEDFTFVHEIKALLAAFYKYLTPVIALSGLLALILFFVISNPAGPESSKISQLMVVVLALYCSYLSRIMVCVMVDISSFPAIVPHYLGVAYPLLATASTGSIACLVQRLSSRGKPVS